MLKRCKLFVYWLMECEAGSRRDYKAAHYWYKKVLEE